MLAVSHGRTAALPGRIEEVGRLSGPGFYP
jgi:hypothetical protein